MPTDHRATALAIFVAALVGSGLFVLLGLYWPRTIIDWMRVIVVDPPVYPPPAELAFKVAAVFTVAAACFAVAIQVARWSLKRLRIIGPATALATILAFVFVLGFAAEATSQLMRARGNLTASDATGLLIDDARLTWHGWETIGRRAAVASLYAALIAAAFAGTKFVLREKDGHS